jgi:hypothetical protein
MMEAEQPPTNEMEPRERRKRIIIFCLCLMGAFRVFAFNAAFPLFNNVDEDAHFDLVYKYSQGHLPCSWSEKFSRESSELIMLYGTWEYLEPEESPEDSAYQPLWKLPNARETSLFSEGLVKKQRYKNHEMGAFPIYYLVAGLWYRVEQLFGLGEGDLIYSIRFLNVPLFTLLVWFSYLFARALFPEKDFQQIGLPLIVAFFPQDVFYSINSDALSPLLFAMSFFLLLQLHFESKSYRYHLLTGLVVSATVLTKISNVTVLALLCIIIVLKIRRLAGEKKVKAYFPRLITLLAAATIPVVIWLTRNYVVLGDVTGSADKIAQLGWSLKPLSKLWDHPILTPRGLLFFLTELTKTFWRGEIVWHLERIASKSADIFYIISTAFFILASALCIILNIGKANKQYRFVLAISFCVLILSVLMLAVLSMLYDFGKSWYPSQKLPYFVSGRLISGVLLPFLLIYIDGLERIFWWLKGRVNLLIILAIIAIGITLSELSVTSKVFKSPCNWFHMEKYRESF